MRPMRLLFFAFLALLPALSFAAPNCVDTEGEAAIEGNDIPSAKAEAVSRAKWAAMEEAAGVEVKAQTIVQNFSLVDDAVSKTTRGAIADWRLTGEKAEDGVYKVKIRACVERAKAEEALSSLAMNSSIVVFFPAKNPETGQYEEANPLSEAMISALTEHGYQVVDAAPGEAVDAGMIEKAMKTGNYSALKALVYKYLANVMLIGKIDYTVSTRKGEDIGYGLSMPMNNVTVRLAYRLISRDKSGKAIVLHAATDEAKGLSSTVEDATQKGIKALRDRIVPKVLDAMAKHINSSTKKITLSVRGVPDLDSNFAVKGAITQTAWVTTVEEKGLGEFLVGYPENIVYLLNSLGLKGFRPVSFTDHSATVENGL